MKLCVVTCTGGRPELFALCRRWVERQTLKPDVWLIATDIDEPVAGAPEWARSARIGQAQSGASVEKAHHTLSKALRLVPAGHHAVLIEDDDWYPPNYLAEMSLLLCGPVKLAACNVERRYNVPTRAWTEGIPPTPNAGCTAIHADHIAEYADILMGPKGSDNAAWKQMGGARQNNALRTAIKGVGFGLPGRAGATSKHNPEFVAMKNWHKDPDLSKLIDWIGEDAFDYANLCTAPRASL